ncbi:MAG: hypothetical protein HY235_23835 [Acidobacteria bacterium]|nr:hypothetical protein [Acidobacteriota bacterium]
MITTTQSGISQIEIAGSLVTESSDAKTDGFVSVFALFGSLTTPEARTAARSGAHEMAVNAKPDDKFLFSFTDFSNVLSQAYYSIESAPENVFLNHGALDFVLPASYLEVTSNAESPRNEVEAVLLADLRVCFSSLCPSTPSCSPSIRCKCSTR